MILQNAGLYRRQAIETVVTSGWTEPIARALGSLLRSEQNEAWLRIRAQFALSFLQRRDRWVEDQLVRSCQQAYRKLRLNETPTTPRRPARTSPRCTPPCSPSVTASAWKVPRNARKAPVMRCGAS
jgi:hypothetical protein